MVITGDDLLQQNYPMIHAVGRASPRPPCLIDLTWGHPTAPKVTLVGKGVCFDSGGLDLKPASAMKLMKKDIGGAAHVLGLAAMVMGRPVCRYGYGCWCQLWTTSLPGMLSSPWTC